MAWLEAKAIARAMLDCAEEHEITLPEMDDARVDIGYGVQASIDGRRVRGRWSRRAGGQAWQQGDVWLERQR